MLSIVIPSHNRQIYAAIAVRKIVEILSDAQVIVSDTSTDESLRDMLPANVEYVRPGRPMDVVSHFEFALARAHGRYVMFLGDDDCVGPGLEQIVRWADRHDVDAVVSYGKSFIANYFWPGIRSRFYGDGYASKLFVHPFTGEARRIDPIAALRDALHNLGQGLGAMPRVYHGLASRALIDRVRDRFGTLFSGVTPDISSAAMLSGLARNVWQVDYPFSLPGGSPASTAGTGAAGTDMTSLTQHPHTAAFSDLRWDPLIPEYYAPYIVWAYSLKQAADRLDRSDLSPNLAYLYAVSLLRHRRQRDRIIQSLRCARTASGGIGLPAVGLQIVRELGLQGKRIANRLASPGPGGRAQQFGNLPDIGVAYDRLQQYITDTGIIIKLPNAAI
ncbi:glycosyltransferase [Sphingomonas sp. Leaf10]|uniref:glycosyltransferase n=1 Tax=Sphingomonas sp. Leaf10 TaxID=1735676 RepID=UPI0006FE2839|nr:glycosyltransferase [Sphingomonas sp. Leaf10]KQM36608.1 hypothetical protein ASE59_15020 [Sphingomonas sp. Leaf10]